MGGNNVKKSEQQVDDMFNYGKKLMSESQGPTAGTASNTFKASMGSMQHIKGSIGSSMHNISAVNYADGQPERTSIQTSVIELNSMVGAGPVSKPQRNTPSPSYFTK